MDKGEIILYKPQDENVAIDVLVEDETVWLTLDQMSEMFKRDKSTISRHIHNVFKEGELIREVVVAKFATTTQHGAMAGKTQTHVVEHFNLDVIICKLYIKCGSKTDNISLLIDKHHKKKQWKSVNIPD